MFKRLQKYAGYSGLSPYRIGVFRALQLGDLLCAIPGIRAIKKTYPKAQLELIGLPWSREFARRFNSYFSGYLKFPGHPELPELTAQPGEYENFLAAFKNRHYDLVLQMHGDGGITNEIIKEAQARFTGGFYDARNFDAPDPNLFLPYPDDVNEIYRHLQFAGFLGAEELNADLEFPFLERDFIDYEQLMITEFLCKDSYICIHPGARALNRRWPLHNFIELGKLAHQLGLKVVITGSLGERELAVILKTGIPGKVIDTTGMTSLGSLALLIKNSALLVANDTGVSHLAAALEVPSLILSQGSAPRRWAPLNQELNLTYEWNKDPDLTRVKGLMVRQLINNKNGITEFSLLPGFI